MCAGRLRGGFLLPDSAFQLPGQAAVVFQLKLQLFAEHSAGGAGGKIHLQPFQTLDLPADGRLSASFLGAAVLELTGRGEETAWFGFLNQLRHLGQNARNGPADEFLPRCPEKGFRG